MGGAGEPLWAACAPSRSSVATALEVSQAVTAVHVRTRLLWVHKSIACASKTTCRSFHSLESIVALADIGSGPSTVSAQTCGVASTSSPLASASAIIRSR